MTFDGPTHPEFPPRDNAIVQTEVVLEPQPNVATSLGIPSAHCRVFAEDFQAAHDETYRRLRMRQA